MAELALELLCQRAASRSTFGKKLYQHVSFDPRRDCCHLADSLRNAPPLLAGGRRSLDRRVPTHDRADPSADAARRSRPGHCGRPGGSQTGETFTSELTIKPTASLIVLPFLDCHDQGRCCEDGLQGHRLRYPGVRWRGGVRRHPTGTDVSPSPLNLQTEARFLFLKEPFLLQVLVRTDFTYCRRAG